MTILLAVSAWAGPEPVPPRTFGDWVVGCDNGGRCRAVAGHADGPGPILILEREPMIKLAADGELMMYRHAGFWHPMDTLRDKYHLEQLWANGRAPWKVWD